MSHLDPVITSLLAAEAADLADRLQRSVVQVHAQRGGGSGIVWPAANGRIVTNSHVVTGDKAEIETGAGRQFTARHNCPS